MGTYYHNAEFWFNSCLFHPKGVHIFALNHFFMSDKLEADKRERKEVNACVAFTRWQNVAEMSYSNWDPKKGGKQK